jgi:hypothetical protein
MVYTVVVDVVVRCCTRVHSPFLRFRSWEPDCDCNSGSGCNLNKCLRWQPLGSAFYSFGPSMIFYVPWVRNMRPRRGLEYYFE